MMTKNEFLKSIGTMNRYSLLARMQSDCDYIINTSEGSYKEFKHLWARNPKEQIAYMRYLLDSFLDDEKPDWICEADIDKYEKALVKEEA